MIVYYNEWSYFSLSNGICVVRKGRELSTPYLFALINLGGAIVLLNVVNMIKTKIDPRHHVVSVSRERIQ